MRGAGIRERQPANLDAAANVGPPAGLGHIPVVDLRRRVEHVQHALPRRHAALQDIGHPAERDHRPAQHHQIRIERDELADGDASGNRLAAAEPQHEQRADTHQQPHARVVRPLQANQRLVPANVFIVGAAKTLDLRSLLPVCADDADAGERFLRDGADLGELLLNLLETLMDGGAEIPHDH
jgi:hypothetical protein